MNAVALTPALKRGLFTTLLLAEKAAAVEAKPRRHAIEVVRYECPECSEVYDWEDDAESCCEDAAGAAPEPQRRLCPVCAVGPDTDYPDYEDLANCCLWHDFDHPTRMRMARLVRDGATWAEAIAKEVRP